MVYFVRDRTLIFLEFFSFLNYLVFKVPYPWIDHMNTAADNDNYNNIRRILPCLEATFMDYIIHLSALVIRIKRSGIHSFSFIPEQSQSFRLYRHL